MGKTKGTMTSLNLLANTSLSTPDEFKQLVIKEKNGVLVHLEDVADVELGAEDYNSNISFNGKNGIFMGLWCLPTANTLEVVKHIRAELPQLRALLPSGMKLDVSYDSSIYIEHAITEVTHTLIETLIIVVIVIFLFLGSFRSVLIPMVTIPISLVGTALILLIAGFTINLLTLLAIVLAVGLVVDDAIIVVENIERYLQKGLSPYHASMKGARELVAPIIGMTMTLVAVYTPLGVQSGLTGALFREFSLTLAGAVVISGIVALTLSPMMSSLLLRADENKTGFSGVISRCFSGLQEQYKKMLTSLLHYRGAILIMALLWIALLPVLYFFSKKELAPQEDKGIVSCIIEAAPNATVDQILIYTQLLNGIFKDLPETEKFFQLVNSGSGSAGGHSGIITKPWKERQRTTQELVPILNQKVAEIPGVRIFATVPPPLPGGMKLPINFVVSGMVEPEQLLKVTHQLMSAANQSGLFSYVDDDLKYDQPQLEITFDRNKVSSLGLNLQQVASDLSVLFSGAYVNRFSIQGQSYKVIPQIKREDRLNSDQLKKIYVTGPPIIPLDAPPGTKPQPQLIQLSTFASFKQSTQPRELKHFQQMNSVSITGALAPGVSLDEGLKFLEKTASKIVPSGYVIDYAGESRQLHTEGNRLLKTMLFSFLFIFLVLAAQFESFRDPIIVLFGSVPLALSGALLFSFLGWTTINIYSQVGLITLIGLVSKNGILIVQFANRRQLEGMSSWDAIIDAASIRLRPILMISIATIAGHLPLIFAKGPGAAARNSIGIVLVSGMAIGTLFTLFVVPAIYLFISRKKTLASKHYLHGNAFEHTITLA
ncbi:MAG: MMPL family transporter [Verrucomicrobia bacterium]|nr:MAG: MMPL family transporter [Verrucomicrobiota bacterium]